MLTLSNRVDRHAQGDHSFVAGRIFAGWFAATAAVRHALLAAMFGALLLLPIATVLMPPLRVGVPVESRATLLPLVTGVDDAKPIHSDGP